MKVFCKNLVGSCNDWMHGKMLDKHKEISTSSCLNMFMLSKFPQLKFGVSGLSWRWWWWYNHNISAGKLRYTCRAYTRCLSAKNTISNEVGTERVIYYPHHLQTDHDVVAVVDVAYISAMQEKKETISSCLVSSLCWDTWRERETKREDCVVCWGLVESAWCISGEFGRQQKKQILKS